MIDPIYLAVRVLIYYMITGLPVWQSQSESGWDLFVFFFFFFFSADFFRVGKSLACLLS